MQVHGGRQAEPLQHSLAPGKPAIFTEIFQDKESGAFLQTLHNARRVGGGGGPDQQVKAFRHENVAENSEL